MTAMPLCRYGCGRLERLWNGKPDLDYHPKDCPGHKIQREEWSMLVYGVPDITTAQRHMGKVKVTLEITLDTFDYFVKDKVRKEIRESYQATTRSQLWDSNMWLGTNVFQVKKSRVKNIEFLEHKPQPDNFQHDNWDE